MDITITEGYREGSSLTITNDGLDNPNFVMLQLVKNDDLEICMPIAELKRAVDAFYNLSKDNK